MHSKTQQTVWHSSIEMADRFFDELDDIQAQIDNLDDYVQKHKGASGTRDTRGTKETAKDSGMQHTTIRFCFMFSINNYQQTSFVF